MTATKNHPWRTPFHVKSMRSEMLKRLRVNLKRLREEHGLSQLALATRLGIRDDEVGHFEQGRRTITDLWIHRFSDAMGVPSRSFYEPVKDGQET